MHNTNGWRTVVGLALLLSSAANGRHLTAPTKLIPSDVTGHERVPRVLETNIIEISLDAPLTGRPTTNVFSGTTVANPSSEIKLKHQSKKTPVKKHDMEHNKVLFKNHIQHRNITSGELLNLKPYVKNVGMMVPQETLPKNEQNQDKPNPFNSHKREKRDTPEDQIKINVSVRLKIRNRQRSGHCDVNNTSETNFVLMPGKGANSTLSYRQNNSSESPSRPKQGTATSRSTYRPPPSYWTSMEVTESVLRVEVNTQETASIGNIDTTLVRTNTPLSTSTGYITLVRTNAPESTSIGYVDTTLVGTNAPESTSTGYVDTTLVETNAPESTSIGYVDTTLIETNAPESTSTGYVDTTLVETSTTKTTNVGYVDTSTWESTSAGYVDTTLARTSTWETTSVAYEDTTLDVSTTQETTPIVESTTQETTTIPELSTTPYISKRSDSNISKHIEEESSLGLGDFEDVSGPINKAPRSGKGTGEIRKLQFPPEVVPTKDLAGSGNGEEEPFGKLNTDLQSTNKASGRGKGTEELRNSQFPTKVVPTEDYYEMIDYPTFIPQIALPPPTNCTTFSSCVWPGNLQDRGDGHNWTAMKQI